LSDRLNVVNQLRRYPSRENVRQIQREAVLAMAEPLFTSILLPGEQSLQSVQIAGKGEADLQAGQRPQMPGDSRGEVRTDRLLNLLPHRGLSRLAEVECPPLHRLVECSTN